MKRTLKYLAVITFVALSNSCGGGSNIVHLEINGTPRVFTNPKEISDLKGDDKTLTSPHFSFRLSVQNASTTQSFVMTGFEIRILTESGFSRHMEIVPSDCLYSELNGVILLNRCGLFSRSVFTALGPKSELVTFPIDFYVDSLPVQERGNFVYQVELEVFGFLSDETDLNQAIEKETDRLPRTVLTFSTE